MQVAIALVVGFVVFVLLAFVAGLTAFLAVPIGLMVVLAPLAVGLFATVFRGSDEEQPRGGQASSPGVPSSREASYHPISAPEDRL